MEVLLELPGVTTARIFLPFEAIFSFLNINIGTKHKERP
jgi:hypothetical protein